MLAVVSSWVVVQAPSAAAALINSAASGKRADAAIQGMMRLLIMSCSQLNR
jgi:hypothetical protein